MPDFKTTRDLLVQALRQMTPDSAEWVKTTACVAALDDAQRGQVSGDFIHASRRLDDALAKLDALLAGLPIDPDAGLLDLLTRAWRSLQPVAEQVATLAGGEPATALPAMALSNLPGFPQPGMPATPPVRLFFRGVAPVAPPARNVDDMISDILRREGGFVDHPADRGGATNFGITQRTLSGWRKRAVTVDEVRALGADEAARIYRANYYTGPHIDRLPQLIQPVMFDMSINHGPGTAVRILQRVLATAMPPCEVDGGIGDQTVRSAEGAARELGTALVNRIVDARKAFFQQIVAGDASQQVFLKGWLNRADEFAVA